MVKRYWILSALALVLSAFLTQMVAAQDGRNSCIASQFSGPEYASITYKNTCNETIVTKICSKFFVAELWNALKGDSTGGKWRCSGVRLINPGNVIGIQIAAVEASSIARKAMAQSSYRIYSCDVPYKPITTDAARGAYECFLDPADRETRWDSGEFDRLTATKIYGYDDETVMGFSAREIDCNPDISHEIAAVFPDVKMVPEDVISELRYVHLGISIHSKHGRCRLNGSDWVKFQFNAFVGQEKVFVLNYAVNDRWVFGDYAQARVAIQGVLKNAGYLADECSAEYTQELVGVFFKEKSVSVDQVIDDMRRAHSSAPVIERFRRCYGAGKRPDTAAFKYLLVAHPNISKGQPMLTLVYDTDGIEKAPDFGNLREDIRSGLEQTGFLKN